MGFYYLCGNKTMPMIDSLTYSSEESRPLISFIVTTYNLPIDYLVEALKSITRLSLNKREREIILVDDGSDLTPLNELVELRDEIIYLRQANHGLSSARNLGLRMAVGNYIQFIDGDDFLLQAPYEHCLDIMRFHHPDLVIFTESTKKDVKTPYAFEGPMSGREYMRSHNLRGSACGYIFARQALGSLRFRVGSTVEDEEFTPQLVLRCEQVYVTAAKAYYYRQRKGSLVHDKSEEYRQRRLQDAEQVIYHLRHLAERLPEADRNALNRRVAQLTADLLYNVITFTHSGKQLDETIRRLEERGLYPLPNKNCSRKYGLFRKMIGNKLGRKLLLLTLGRR